MTFFYSRPFRLFWIVLCLIAAVSAYGIHSLRSARLHALFDGPPHVLQSGKPSYYNRIVYNLPEISPAGKNSNLQSSNAPFATDSTQEDIPWVDGEARDEVEAAMRQYTRQTQTLDGFHQALDRFQSPTVYQDRKPAAFLQISNPPNGAIYPPNFCPPYVEWEDPRNNLWQIILRSPNENNEQVFYSEIRRWRFPDGLWNNLCKTARSEEFTIQIRGILRDNDGQRAGTVQATPEWRLKIAEEEADNYIVYRLVDPPFNSFKTPDIFVRDIRQDEPELLLSARRQYCLNCHTFSSKQGNTGKLAIQVRSLVTTMHKLPVYLSIYDMDKRTGYKVQLPFEIQMTTFMAWSPDGNQLAYSANQKVAAIKPITFETQLAGMATSDIAIYDTERNDTWLVPGASDPNQLEIYPYWTPDGKSMVFSRSPVGQHPAHILFDLYIISLDAEDPSAARPIEGASHNGRSNYYSHFSPDGKWFSFCQCDGGDLIRASSDLYLKSGDLTGPAIRLECNSDYAADSWHSWSSNSRWLVFASKRDSGIYASLYLTHIDEAGRSSPAIPLPMENQPFASLNIPEFMAHRPSAREKDLFEAIRVETVPRIAKLRSIIQEDSYAR